LSPHLNQVRERLIQEQRQLLQGSGS